MKIELFKHNSDAYEIALEMLAETGKAAIIHPTGTGKSFIAFKLCEDYPEDTVCWLSPSEYIFQTQLENLSKVTGGSVPQNIKFFTYSKLMLMSEDEMALIRPDHIVIDEFHRCGAEFWGKGVQQLLKLYPKAPVLGLSATAIRYLDNQRNMADELFDGNVASEMTLGEAIVRGILNPPIYVTAYYSYDKKLEEYERRVKNAKTKAVRDAGERYIEALRRAIEMSEGLDVVFKKHITDTFGKYIVFCANAEHMREMISHADEWFGGIDPDYHIYSAYSSDPETSKAFKRFKADNSEHLKLLFCIDMLNEGVHVEDVSGVILFRPTVSPIVFKQQIGRALCAGKRQSAVILDIVNNIENLYSISDIQEEMREVVTYYNFIGEEQFVVNESFRIIDEVQNCRVLFEELERTLGASWDCMYEEAKKYYESHGDLLPLQNYETEEGYKLGQWVVSQRVAYKNGELSEEKVEKLTSVGMSWLNYHQRLWEEGYALAKEYYNKNGNLALTDSRSKLGLWLIKQRQNYRRSQLSKEYFERLESLGMIWEIEDTWNLRIADAKEYYEKFGNLDIPAGYITAEGVHLGTWYRSIRSKYNAGILPEEKIEQLERIGVKWSSVIHRNWMNFYGIAEKYYKTHGDLNVNASYETESGEALGTWVSTQRNNYSKGKLDKEKIELLEKIGMSWNRDISRWEEGYKYSYEYKTEFGNINVPAEYLSRDGFALGAWISNQRRKYKNNKLTESQISRLEALGIVWDPMEALWMTSYEYAKNYYLQHKNLLVNIQYVTDDGFKLGSWISNQKTKYKKAKLSTEKISMLEKIGMCWSTNAEKWMRGYEQAIEHFQEYGNLDVSKRYVRPNGYSLGIWIYSQRQSYKNGKLEPDKIEKLEALSMKWNSTETDDSDSFSRGVSVRTYI